MNLHLVHSLSLFTFLKSTWTWKTLIQGGPCVCLWVCCLYSVCSNTHTHRHTLLSHPCSTRLTSTTLTFESNPSNPLARPCLTKDNPHRSAPAQCLPDSAITAVPQNYRLPFFFFVWIVPPLMWSIYNSVMCAWKHECAFLHRGKKQYINHRWLYDVYCVSPPSAKGNNESMLFVSREKHLSIEQYRVCNISCGCFVRGHIIFMYFLSCDFW